MAARFIERSMPCRGRSVCGAPPTVGVLACTTCAIVLRRTPSCNGTGPVRTPNDGCPCCLPTSVMSSQRYLLVPQCLSGTDARGDVPPAAMLGGTVMNTTTTSLASLLERFFTQRLMQQRQASPHTISSYRDTFRLLLKFAQQRLHTTPAQLTFEAIDAPLITAFLAHLEKHRGLSARSRNLRLTAVHSFFRYVAFEAPDHAAQIQRVLAIPSKRFTRTQVHFLTRPEIKALLAAPDQQTWFGRRDHAFLLVAAQTGLRLSEMTGLTHKDVMLGTGAHIRVIGKGRKERCVPLAKHTVAVLRAWLRA